MKRIWTIAALAFLIARGGAAQDTTHAPAAATAAAPAAAVTVMD